MTSVFEIVLFALTAIYAFSILYLLRGLYRTGRTKNSVQHHITVVVPVHNEEKRILKCLESIGAQDYPAAKYEVIIANDRSTDRTSVIVEQFTNNRPNFKLIHVDPDTDVVPKKGALLKAVSEARGEVIVTTDADCIHPSGWLSRLNSYFTDDMGMIVGNTAYPVPENIWKGIDALDYFSHRAMGAAFIGAGSAYTCTSSNLAYRKSIFDQAKEKFAKLKIRPADDNYLLNFVHQNTGYKIAVATDKDSVVVTDGALNLKHFFNQRCRWASYGNIVPLGMKLFFIPALLYYGIIWLTVFLSLYNSELLGILAITLAVKIVIDFIFILKSTSVFDCRYLLKYFFPAWTANLVLVPLVIFISSTAPFTWKERKYTQTAEVKT